MNPKVKLLNNSWTPLLGITLTASVVFIYVLYPIIYNIAFLIHWHIHVMPTAIADNLNSILLGGGIIAALRTAQKRFGTVENEIKSNSSLVKLIFRLSPYWRPAMAFSIVFCVFYLYILVPFETIFVDVNNISKIVPLFVYTHIKELLIAGGFLGALKVYEKSSNIA